ncbi:hypothetical protein [Alkalicoccus chagannorensis]|uniref:hypothetical protein n=1 Tax=Alkalicoccus chagannorensis TaxID=427072 RepID=UPI00041A674B|nr:hypothetical protein [Alkalicoccus chagannorensis]
MKMQRAYLIKGTEKVVIQKSMAPDVSEDGFQEVMVFVPMDEIKMWAEEIEMMGLDEDDEEYF